MLGTMFTKNTILECSSLLTILVCFVTIKHTISSYYYDNRYRTILPINYHPINKLSFNIMRGYYMWLADQWKDYEVIDSCDGEKLERWGEYLLVRPDPQVG